MSRPIDVICASWMTGFGALQVRLSESANGHLVYVEIGSLFISDFMYE